MRVYGDIIGGNEVIMIVIPKGSENWSMKSLTQKQAKNMSIG